MCCEHVERLGQWLGQRSDVEGREGKSMEHPWSQGTCRASEGDRYEHSWRKRRGEKETKKKTVLIQQKER